MAMSRRWSRNGSILGRSPAKNTISGRSSPLKISGTPYRINDLRVFRRTLVSCVNPATAHRRRFSSAWNRDPRPAMCRLPVADRYAPKRVEHVGTGPPLPGGSEPPSYSNTIASTSASSKFASRDGLCIRSRAKSSSCSDTSVTVTSRIMSHPIQPTNAERSRRRGGRSKPGAGAMLHAAKVDAAAATWWRSGSDNGQFR